MKRSFRSVVVKTNRKPNPDAAIVYDRPEKGHYGTGILMLFIRKRRHNEKHERAGGTITTREIAPNWIVDFDGDGKPIDIEVLSPSKHFPKAILDILPPEFVLKKPPRKRRVKG